MAAIPATQTSRPWITEAIIDLTNTDDTAAWLNGLTSGGIKHCPLAAAGIEYHQEHARILLSSPRSVHSTTQPTLAQLFDELDKWNAWSHAVGLQAVRCQGDTLVLGPRQELEQTQGDRSLAK